MKSPLINKQPFGGRAFVATFLYPSEPNSVKPGWKRKIAVYANGIAGATSSAEKFAKDVVAVLISVKDKEIF